ncbi:MAG: hypothetical protein LW875_03450 [Proteobacteria bacterium]|jgi:hypothetical protein|nr:hypothetical protein [Pseudomonadota bacterium]
MTVEYILLVSLFVMFLMGSLIAGPTSAFKTAGPKLGARVEKQLATGEGFKVDGRNKQRWVE